LNSLPPPSAVWAKGNCRDADTEIFYPDRDAATYSAIAAEAKSYCRGDSSQVACPVILECLFYGLITEDRFGIWGGMSPRERNALRRTGSLERYRTVQHLKDSPYYGLIENYLERSEDPNEEDRQ
jgi:hypothetical protein